MSSREPVRWVRLRTILALLLLFTIFPLGLFAGRLVDTSWRQQRDMVNAQNVERARASDVGGRSGSPELDHGPEALAARGPLESKYLQAFHDVATRMLSLELGWQAVRLGHLDSRVVDERGLFPERERRIYDDARSRLDQADRLPARFQRQHAGRGIVKGRRLSGSIGPSAARASRAVIELWTSWSTATEIALARSTFWPLTSPAAVAGREDEPPGEEPEGDDGDEEEEGEDGSEADPAYRLP